MYRTNEEIARRVYRALKTPTDNNPRTDPILAFHFRGKEDSIMLRCNKVPEISIKGKDQIAGEVKFFAYSDFKEHRESDVLFKLKDEITLIELYRKGAIEAKSAPSPIRQRPPIKHSPVRRVALTRLSPASDRPECRRPKLH